VAVFLVSTVGSVNNYIKELQFRALENVAQKDERTTVIRNGQNVQINPMDVVVGDILLLQHGNAIPADCIVCDLNIVKVNESSLTGETDDLKKSKDGDCFLLSSCLITEADNDVHALVTGIGSKSANI